MFWSGAASWRSAGAWTRRGLAASWIVTAAAHAGAFVIHARLDALLDAEARQVREGAVFHGPHEAYLIATSIEWGAALVWLLAALFAWRGEDRATSASPGSGP
ncbi:MAG: hypothetical protein HY293_01465 [Planctomycetes bacterium]|nr:hypothetical protein [Planctomycetota bacterium]